MPNIQIRGSDPLRRSPHGRHMLGVRPRRTVPLLLSLATCLLQVAPGRAAGALILGNGNFYTGAAVQPRAAAVVVLGVRITFVGSTADAMHRAPGARQIDLRGATVLPGLTDAHAHLADVGERELIFNL